MLAEISPHCGVQSLTLSLPDLNSESNVWRRVQSGRVDANGSPTQYVHVRVIMIHINRYCLSNVESHLDCASELKKSSMSKVARHRS